MICSRPPPTVTTTEKSKEKTDYVNPLHLLHEVEDMMDDNRLGCLWVYAAS